MGGALQHITRIIGDIFFPIFCVHCHAEGCVLCDTCFASCVPEMYVACSICKAQNDFGETCSHCMSQASINRLLALHAFTEEGLLCDLIYTLKYNYHYQVIDIFASLCKKTDVFDRIAARTYDVIVPIPLHWRRLAERGFNQSLLIAEILSKNCHIPIDQKSVIRSVYTKQQALLDKQSRIQNMHNAFAVKTSKTHFLDKRVLLVDDVYTIGATMQSCAKILQASGAQYVDGFVLARGTK